jgi:hypothetical protein
MGQTVLAGMPVKAVPPVRPALDTADALADGDDHDPMAAPQPETHHATPGGRFHAPV